MTVSANKNGCIECQKEAKFYSKYDKKEVLFCSAVCHDEYNQKASVSNFLLVQLADETTNDENTSENDDEQNLSAVFKACRRGEENHEELFSLLGNGEAANQRNGKGQTLLTYSIAKGDLKTLDILLGAGADVNEPDGNSVTPLMVAASIEAEQKVAFLLERDADVLIQDNEGKTALHKTETNKNPNCAKLLLEKDPSLINVKCNFEQTAVHVAAGEGNNVILAVFLETDNVNLTDVDNIGRTPLHCSVIRRSEKCLELLLGHKDGDKVVDVADRFGFCPIHYAIQANNINMVRMLVKKGCDTNKPDNNGQTSLLSAASCGYTDICKVLLDQSKNKDAIDSGGQSALHHAAAHGDVEMCELLIQNGADVNLRDKQKQTCIYRAACNAKSKAVTVLIDNGALCDGSVKDVDGRTPLHHVTEKGHEEVLRVLLNCDQIIKNGDDPEKQTFNLLDNEGESALYLAALHDHKECCQALMDNGVIVDDKSRRFLLAMGLVKEEVEVKPESEPGDTSPRNRYAADKEPPSDSEPVEDLAIEHVADHELVANNSRHISNAGSTTSSSGSEKRKHSRALKTRRTSKFGGHQNSPYLQSMLTEEILFKNQRYLGIRPTYLTKSRTNLSLRRSQTDLESIFSDSNWSESVKKNLPKVSHKKKFSYAKK